MRLPRVQIPGIPSHLTHRGNHKRQVFFGDQDRREYLSLLGHYASVYEVQIWSYCLMLNHVHVIAVGTQPNSISNAMQHAHRTYARRRNEERRVTGHLWANRFFSSLLDETHLWAAVRYVECNPVRARIVCRATDYRWSSAQIHAGITGNTILHPDRPFPGPIGDWQGWLDTGLDDPTADRIRRATSTGRVCGSDEFVSHVERLTGRSLRLARRGPKPGSKRRRLNAKF